MIGASIGVAVAPRDGRHGEELLSAADLALYQAKAQRARGWRFFEPRMNDEAQARRELERDLQHGLANEEFELFYQPVLDVCAPARAGVRGADPLAAAAAGWCRRPSSSRYARRPA